MMPWRAFLARAVVASGLVGVAMFAAIRLATADPGGPTRDALTYAGVLRERAGMANTRLTFVFNRGGAARCTATTEPFTPDSNGAFSVLVPLSGSGCPNGRSFFDGDDVQYDVRLGDATGEVIASNVPVSPVPYARYADNYGTPECPVGYERNPTSPSGRVYCRKALAGGLYDEIVRVGSGPTAFWIDRYEVSVNYARDASGMWLFEADRDLSFFSRNGQWGRASAGHAGYAISAARTPGAPPARWITWFQALEVCAESGKALPTGSQWLRAAQGTPDDGSLCQIDATAPRPAMMGGCESSWGAQDMIGNLWEWTDEWYAGTGHALSLPGRPAITIPMVTPTTTIPERPALSPGLILDGVANWPSEYREDGTWNINGTVRQYSGFISGVPSVAARGGSRAVGNQAGIFAMLLSHAPSSWSADLGFRCVIPR